MMGRPTWRLLRTRGSIDQLDPMIDDIEERLCSDCLKELKEEEYYEEYQDADELDSMLGEYEGDW